MTLLQWQKSKTQQSCDRKQRFHTTDLKRRCACPLYHNCENTSAHPHSIPCLAYSQYIQDTQHLSHMTTYTQQSICHTSEHTDYRALFVHHYHNAHPVCHSVSMSLLAKHNNIQLKNKQTCHWLPAPTPPNNTHTHITQSVILGVKFNCRNDSCCIHTITSISVLQTLKLKSCAGFAVSCMPEWCHSVGPAVMSVRLHCIHVSQY